MTRNEIYRTAYPFKERAVLPDGTLGREKNRDCPSCKQTDCEHVRDAATLNEYKKFYGSRKFMACKCSFCGAEWSYYDIPG